MNSIEEAKKSPALRLLLKQLAQPGSSLITLGCDLGAHVEAHRPLMQHRVAGGYVQVATAPLGDGGVPKLVKLSRAAETTLKEDVGEDEWEVQFTLCRVDYKFSELIEAHSVWIWFFAAASSPKRAREARERLLTSLRRGLLRNRELASECDSSD